MLTDWLLIARLARELEDRLRRARVEDAGLLPDGRVAILFRKRGESLLLASELFASPPVMTLEQGELGISAEPNFVRVLARSLRAMVLAGVAARRNDRLLRLDFASRSRFGIEDTIELYYELVPRFGNAILVKAGKVVAAYKEFGRSENSRRAVHAGAPYELPPLPARVTTLAPLGLEKVEDALSRPLYVYRGNGKLLQAYVTPLERFADAKESRENSLFSIFSELRAQQQEAATSVRAGARRRAILKRLDVRDRKLRTELESLAQKRRRAEQRQTLRMQGEELYATLHDVPEAERESAKARARELFAAYQNLAKSLPHLGVRERTVTEMLEAVEMLRWETERASDEDLEAVETAVAALGPKRRAPSASQPRGRKRALLELRTARGSRIVVGRSPLENAELTFRLARPNDLWFHAQRTPGAHVILTRAERGEVPPEDLELAASLAAFYSRAKTAVSVPVDYTLRKHVRKQRAAPPGLVWYTHANTINAQPKSIESLR
jgi:predicted ribosome quality control (RQC) complex YloA/Tae2 family protein